MSNPEQGNPAGPERRTVDRDTSSTVAAHKLAKAADTIGLAVADITASMHELQQALNGGEGMGIILSLLKDRSERMETNLATLQHTVNMVVDEVSDPRMREKEFLGSLLTVTLDVGDTLETVKEALAGLAHQFEADREATGCAWRTYLTRNGEGAGLPMFADLAKIAAMADRLTLVVREDLSSKGYDPDTGKKREWFNVQVDKVRVAFDSMFINMVVGLILGAGLYAYHYVNEHSQVTKIQAQMEVERLLNQKEKDALVTSKNAETQELRKAVGDLQVRLTQAKSKVGH